METVLQNLETMIDYIRNLDLTYIEERLVTKQKWSQLFAKEAVRRYKNFLILQCKYPKQGLVPVPDIDEAWHEHILHTREYVTDCKIIFGHYHHHIPFHNNGDKKAKKEMKEMIDLYYETAALYHQEFQEVFSLKLDVGTFW